MTIQSICYMVLGKELEKTRERSDFEQSRKTLNFRLFLKG